MLNQSLEMTVNVLIYAEIQQLDKLNYEFFIP